MAQIDYMTAHKYTDHCSFALPWANLSGKPECILAHLHYIIDEASCLRSDNSFTIGKPE